MECKREGGDMNDVTMRVDSRRVYHAEENMNGKTFQVNLSDGNTDEKDSSRSGVDMKTMQEIQQRSKGRYGYRFIKRSFDVVFSFLALVVLSPFLLVLSLVIFLDDPHGSPLYHQPRVGKNGKVFKFWKFRSMVVNAEELLKDLQSQNEKDGPVFKMKNDPRVTRVGRFIRKTSIDELAQLWNVLKGDMSLVGPRPALPREVEQYSEYERLRLLAKPGLTCYWQVKDHRDDIGFDEWLEMDIQYIRDSSFWLDVKLIFRTIKVVLTGQGT